MNVSSYRLFQSAIAMLAMTLTGGATAAETDPHAHHHMPARETNNVQRSQSSIEIPDVPLVREDGAKVNLLTELNHGRPVFVNFIYTTCTTICPLTSQVFSLLQERLGKDLTKVHMVSISIDPEQDTPARLTSYANRFSAGKQWHHYTGTVAASVAVQRAFEAYQGDKMHHTPATFVRVARDKPWVRFDGFATADQLYAEYLSGTVASAR